MAQTSFPMAPEVQDSLEQLKKAQIEKQEAVDRRREIHEQISMLIKQAKVTSDEIRTKEEALHEASTEHNRLSSLRLCTALHSKLPREVRDLIYAEIHGAAHYETIKKYTDYDLETRYIEGPAYLPFTFRNPRMKGDFPHTEHPTLWWPDDHLTRPVATELAERWYQIRMFVIKSKHLYLLPDFLTHDIFNKDLSPSRLIRRVQCKVAIVRNQDAGSKARHLDSLKHIGLIQNKRVDLVIQLYYPRSFWNEEEKKKKEGVREVLGALRPLVRSWREGGLERVAVWNCKPKQEVSVLLEGSEEEYAENLKLLDLDRKSEEEGTG